MILLAAGVVALNLAVWGAHALLPWHLARAPERARRLWARLALPGVGLSVVATAAALRLAPDAAAAWRLHDLAGGELPTVALAVAAGATALADLLLALGWRQLEPAAWRLLAALGALALGAVTLAAELVRIGWGPVPSTAALLAAAALRLPLALAAAEATAGPPRLATPLAGLALGAAVALWPESLRDALGADRATLGAALILLLSARLVPARLRRPAAIAGVLLAALFLARAGEISQALGLTQTLPSEALTP